MKTKAAERFCGECGGRMVFCKGRDYNYLVCNKCDTVNHILDEDD